MSAPPELKNGLLGRSDSRFHSMVALHGMVVLGRAHENWSASASPNKTNRLFVVEQGGSVFAITNLAAPNKTLFLDLSKRVRVGDDEGLFALAFHPGGRSRKQPAR